MTGNRTPQINLTSIIIAEDNAELRILPSEILTDAGYSVRTAADGFAVLAEIKDGAPDILITDLNMPGMSGFELILLVGRRFADIAIIAMSGSYSGHDLPRGMSVDTFYEKGCGTIGPLQLMLWRIMGGQPNESDHPPDNDRLKRTRPAAVPGLARDAPRSDETALQSGTSI